jgi:hypothetical protein
MANYNQSVFNRRNFAMEKYSPFLNLLLVFLMSGFLFAGSSAASVLGRSDPGLERLLLRLAHDRNERKLEKIIEVLEDRIGHRRLSPKVIQKLSAMSEQDLQLVLSLCDRLAKEGDSAGADFALFFVTALIVVS